MNPPRNPPWKLPPLPRNPPRRARAYCCGAPSPLGVILILIRIKLVLVSSGHSKILTFISSPRLPAEKRLEQADPDRPTLPPRRANAYATTLATEPLISVLVLIWHCQRILERGSGAQNLSNSRTRDASNPRCCPCRATGIVTCLSSGCSSNSFQQAVLEAKYCRMSAKHVRFSSEMPPRAIVHSGV